MGIPVALQLYTVRDDAAKNFSGTLEKVAAIGYSGVEFAGYGNLSAARLKELIERLGIFPVGSHVDLRQLENDIDSVISFAVELGNPYIVCPWAPITDHDAVKKYAALFNAFGERIQSAGLEFCYHNHSHEFVRVQGEYALDLLLKETDPSLVEIELDTGWIHAAGADPVEYVKRYAGRCPLIHLKDMKAGEGKELTEVGAGVVNVSGIMDQADTSGVEWIIVEQDTCGGPPLESARISLENMKRMARV